MLFSSTFFIYIFLPTVLVIYYGLCRKQSTKNKVLLISSLLFYAWGEPKFVLIMLLSISANYYFGLLVERARHTSKIKIYLAYMIVFNLGILMIFKYLGFTVQSINDLLGTTLKVPQIALPIGISFFTFQSISYVVDVYRGNGKVLKNPLDVGLYISFFPQLIAGPIVRYETIAKEIHGRRTNVNDFADGISRFIIGLSKKVILSNQFAIIADKAFEIHGTEAMTVSFAWLGAVGYMLQIYFDFGGYSDMAIGLGKMFGFHFNENFNFPYVAKSVSDFWRRWHISLGTWFRDYVYIPLGGNRVSPMKHLRNMMIVWLMTGIWHGANWTFIAWGLYFGILLIIEKFTGLGNRMNRSKVMGHIYTLGLVLLSWVLFRADNLGQATRYIACMFGKTDCTVTNNLAALYFKENLYIFIIGILACMPFSQKAKTIYKRLTPLYKQLFKLVYMLLLGILFLVSVSYLVKGTYNPFIYFNF